MFLQTVIYGQSFSATSRPLSLNRLAVSPSLFQTVRLFQKMVLSVSSPVTHDPSLPVRIPARLTRVPMVLRFRCRRHGRTDGLCCLKGRVIIRKGSSLFRHRSATPVASSIPCGGGIRHGDTGQDETFSPTSLVRVKAGTVRLQRDGCTGEPDEPRLTEIEDIA